MGTPAVVDHRNTLKQVPDISNNLQRVGVKAADLTPLVSKKNRKSRLEWPTSTETSLKNSQI